MPVKSVKPYGMLYTEGKSFFLLSPVPVSSQDTWENGLMRWPVVLKSIIDAQKEYPFDPVYPKPVHLLVSPSNCVIVIRELPTIWVKDGEDNG